MFYSMQRVLVLTKSTIFDERLTLQRKWYKIEKVFSSTVEEIHEVISQTYRKERDRGGGHLSV